MIVVDTSAVLEALVAADPDAKLLDRLGDDGDLHAPHLLDIEALHALRGLVRGGKLSADRASDARTDLAELAITRYGHEPLADRIWQLRDNLTAYDAAFVALAELLETPLVTCDARLGPAAGHDAEVELYASRPTAGERRLGDLAGTARIAGDLVPPVIDESEKEQAEDTGQSSEAEEP